MLVNIVDAVICPGHQYPQHWLTQYLCTLLNDESMLYRIKIITFDESMLYQCTLIKNNHFYYTFECRYNAVHYSKILHTSLQWRRLKARLNLKKTQQISPSQASYGVSFAKILGKIDHIITAPHCISLIQQVLTYDQNDIFWKKKTVYMMTSQDRANVWWEFDTPGYLLCRDH